MMNAILVVCVGNICRSPVAEALLKAHFPDMRIWSAGLAALVGKPADPTASAIAAQSGVDLSGHRAQQISGWMCSEAELILVMETGHRSELEQQFPLARGKIHRLGEGQDGGVDIADPYKKPRSAFEAAHAAIEHSVTHWASRIRKLS
jgi:protein-tyrosine phosphatase